MANVAHPPPALRSPHHRRARLTLSPAAPSSSNANNAPPQHPSARANTRKRPVAALLADENGNDAEPAAKRLGIALAAPHGPLLRIPSILPAPSPAENSPTTTNASRPSSAGKVAPKSDKRSLRSHDGGSRLKSDLAVYFSNYDDIIAGIEVPSSPPDYEVHIHLIDEPLSPTITAKPTPQPRSTAKTLAPPPRHSSTAFQRLDYSTVSRALPIAFSATDASDPLADSFYFAPHRRAERKEKQLRNIEKERAMHEKAQLERLLDGLQGPDWLKVMGITGVTDGERASWEVRRRYFVEEVEGLVNKFREWKVKEKRLRAERERAMGGGAGHSPEVEDEEELGEEARAVTPRVQNHHTNAAPSTANTSPRRPRRPPRPHGFLLPLPPTTDTKPFTSFFATPTQRAAAMGKNRHGRSATAVAAFGHPVPGLEDGRQSREFALPKDWMVEGVLRDNARARRRRGREREEKKEEEGKEKRKRGMDSM